MDTKRSQYLEICQTCLKSNFDRKKGLVCSLTNEHAAFDLREDCPEYAPEEKAIKRQESMIQRKLNGGNIRTGEVTSKAGIIVGVILITGGIIGLVTGIAIMGRFLVLPILLVVFGIVALSKGAQRKPIRDYRGNEDLLDDEII